MQLLTNVNKYLDDRNHLRVLYIKSGRTVFSSSKRKKLQKN